jgi:predicted PurR-regulated permease PerM
MVQTSGGPSTVARNGVLVRSEVYRWFVRGVGFALGVLLVLAVAMALSSGTRVGVLLFVALVLASGLEPYTDYLRGRLPIGRGASVLLVYLAFFLGVVVILVLVVPGAIGQLNEFGTRIGPLLASARTWANSVQPQFLGASLAGVIDALQRMTTSSSADPKPSEVLAFGVTVAEAAISTVSVLALVYFWLTGRPRFQRFLLALLPEGRRAGAREAWNDIEGRLGSWVRAQLLLMGAMGVMTTIAYAVIGLEGALLLGVLAALAEAIPLVGPALGVLPALGVAAMTGDLSKVAIVAGVYVVIQIFEGNILVPMVMRRTMNVPPFLVVAGILVGAAVGGLVGALLAMPVVAALLAVMERMQARDSVVQAEPGTTQEGVPQSEDAPLTEDEPRTKRSHRERGADVTSSP